MAVKVTLFPEQIETPVFALIETEGGVTVITVIAMLLLVTDTGETHDKLLVNTHAIVLLFKSVIAEYVLLFVPTFIPFFFH